MKRRDIQRTQEAEKLSGTKLSLQQRPEGPGTKDETVTLFSIRELGTSGLAKFVAGNSGNVSGGVKFMTHVLSACASTEVRAGLGPSKRVLSVQVSARIREMRHVPGYPRKPCGTLRSGLKGLD